MSFYMRHIVDRVKVSSRHFNFWSKKQNFGKCNLVQVGNVSPEREVPDHIEKPSYFYELMEPGNTIGIPEIKNSEQITRMKDSCKLAANILKSCSQIVQTGTTTDEIDEFVHYEIIKANAYPSPLRYAGFPKSVCTSVNNVACHGIPDDRKLLDGDVINVDITVFYNGFHGDCSRTFLVGNVDDRGKFLVQSTEECLNETLKQCCAPGLPFYGIGRFIESFAKSQELTVIPAFIGHGIGSYFHGPPEIYHHRNSLPGLMKPGMTFTVEPILTLGGPDCEILEDGWTAISVDGARSAQFEHTILITEHGMDILTLPD